MEEYLENGVPTKSSRRQKIQKPKTMQGAMELLSEPCGQEGVMDCGGGFAVVEGG